MLSRVHIRQVSRLYLLCGRCSTSACCVDYLYPGSLLISVCTKSTVRLMRNCLVRDDRNETIHATTWILLFRVRVGVTIGSTPSLVQRHIETLSVEWIGQL